MPATPAPGIISRMKVYSSGMGFLSLDRLASFFTKEWKDKI
jgi:hypothetical protein